MNDTIIQRPDIAILNPRDSELIDRDINILQTAIGGRRQSNSNTYKEIILDENSLVDAISRYTNMTFDEVGGELEMTLAVNDGREKYTMHKNAVMQLASKFKIEGRYISKLLKDNSKWSTDLLAYTLSQYTANTRTGDNGLVRAVVRPEKAQVRAVMSDSYHRYSTGAIYNGLLVDYKDKAIVLKTQYDSLSSYLELISNKLKSFYVDGQLVNMVFGLHIRNSSFGAAALDVRPFNYKVICGNGMTTKSEFRAIHMAGKRNDYGFLSNETLMMEAELNKRKVLDAANFIFSDDKVNEQIYAMTNLGEAKVDAKDIKKLGSLGIKQSEIDQISDIILGGSPEDGLLGNNSAYDVAQAITRMSQDKPLAREKELQDIAGNFIDSVIDSKNKK